jgi:predicted GNAT family acetyltransferase
MITDITVLENTEARTYDAVIGDRVAGTLVYENAGPRRVFTHTVVEPEFRGQGVGSALVRGALDDIRAKRATLTNHCEFVADFIAGHPEYADLIDPVHPGHPRRR